MPSPCYIDPILSCPIQWGKHIVTASHYKLYKILSDTKTNQTGNRREVDYGCCECIEISLQYSMLRLKACLTAVSF